MAVIEKLQPTHVLNCHVNDAFDFTAEQCRFMRANLAERERLYGELVPWDHANYAMDEPWVRAHPYEQTCQPGSEAAIEVVVTNHSTGPHPLQARLVPPPSWRQPASPWVSTEVAAKSDGRVTLAIPIPAQVLAGRHVVAIDVRYGPWDLPQFTEAIIVV